MIIATLVCLPVSITWFVTRHWVLNNMIALCMAAVGLKLVQLNKATPAVLLLSLLFIYDIFWVFGSPYVFPEGKSVMVEVATSMDLPNKLIMPKLLAIEGRSSMLGLGDIVIPGFYLTFLSNLDKALKVKDNAYFNAGMIAYTISFMQCAAVIVIYDSA